jgi:hypothetical protein
MSIKQQIATQDANRFAVWHMGLQIKQQTLEIGQHKPPAKGEGGVVSPLI